MESTSTPIKDIIQAQLDELQQTTMHSVRNLTYDQACVLFGTVFPYELDLTSIDVNTSPYWVTIQDEENMLHLEWNFSDPPTITIEAYLDIFDCETDEDIAHNKTDLTPYQLEAIIKQLHDWGLLP